MDQRIEWAQLPDGSWVAQVGEHRLSAWEDNQVPHDIGWAWRCDGPFGWEESNAAESLEDARAQAEAAMAYQLRRLEIKLHRGE